MKEVWKRRFFILLSVVVLVCCGLIFLLTRSPGGPLVAEEETSSLESQGLVTLELQLSEAEVRELILQEIEKQGYQLQLNLSPQFQLQMPVHLLGQELTFYLEGEAQESDDGNINIDIGSVRAGALTLPRQMALNILDLALPDTSPLHVQNGGLEIDLNRLSESSPVQLRAVSFRPREENYVFEIKFPKKMIFEGMEGAL